MPVSLLTLPYELREQILTALLSHKPNIRLQSPIENRAVFTPPIAQVCKPLREEAIRIFYQTNAFTWTMDPEEEEEAVSFLPVLNDRPIARQPQVTPKNPILSNIPRKTPQPELPDPTSHPLPSALPHLHLHQETHRQQNSLRHLTLALSLPNPYSRKLWQTTFATQLSAFVNNTLDNRGQRLKTFKLLLSSWHYFREICEWQMAVLVRGLGELEVGGDVQVRGRGFGRDVVGGIREVGLGGWMMREGVEGIDDVDYAWSATFNAHDSQTPTFTRANTTPRPPHHMQAPEIISSSKPVNQISNTSHPPLALPHERHNKHYRASRHPQILALTLVLALDIVTQTHTAILASNQPTAA
ncbi:hypothetical protein Q7P36_010498 [Cladosporium allicinum]